MLRFRARCDQCIGFSVVERGAEADALGRENGLWTFRVHYTVLASQPKGYYTLVRVPEEMLAEFWEPVAEAHDYCI